MGTDSLLKMTNLKIGKLYCLEDNIVSKTEIGSFQRSALYSPDTFEEIFAVRSATKNDATTSFEIIKLREQFVLLEMVTSETINTTLKILTKSGFVGLLSYSSCYHKLILIENNGK